MKESDVKIVCNNIKSWITNEDAAIVSVSTDGRLGSIDLRHLVWNIGERFNWKGEKRALFAKWYFPLSSEILKSQQSDAIFVNVVLAL